MGLGAPDPADASYHRYHYASEYASQVDGFFHRENYPYGLPAHYYGWVGINGQITTPNNSPRLNDWFCDFETDFVCDHAAGFLDVTSAGNPPGWIQIGWFSGTAGTSNIFVWTYTISTYLEVDRLTGPYYIVDLGPPSYGEPIIYRIERAAGDGCWIAYIYYNDPIGIFCGLANSGSPQATSEVYDGWGGGTQFPVEMENSNWGWSNPNTNNALRLRGACQGYEPWDTALCAKYTARYDERTTDPTYRISAYNQWYYFTAYGEND